MSIIREALQEAQSSEQVTPNELRKTGSRASVQGPEFGLMPSLAEDIRALRENMEIISNGGKIKVIGITSGASQEGTSTIAAFLAVSIGNGGSTNGAAGSKNSASKNNSGSDASQAVKNVLLIDANLRRPTLHSILGLKIRPGLNDVLERRASWPEALQNVNNGALNVLTAGTPCINPGDALSSSRMNRLLKELRDYYKKIIIDLPPVTSSIETLRLCGWVDGVAYIVCSGRTRNEVAQEALSKLRYANANILGVVLNKRQFHIPERIYGAL